MSDDDLSVSTGSPAAGGSGGGATGLESGGTTAVLGGADPGSVRTLEEASEGGGLGQKLGEALAKTAGNIGGQMQQRHSTDFNALFGHPVAPTAEIKAAAPMPGAISVDHSQQAPAVQAPQIPMVATPGIAPMVPTPVQVAVPNTGVPAPMVAGGQPLMSDRRQKIKIKPMRNEMTDFLDQLYRTNFGRN